ncbi:MAG: aminoacyl--tRNA ligase-related protein [Candidatus Shikimatogenerans sp. Tduv]|uniref:serine--tRNA ligase n=1 Tax=Candidatus Shikimatogenerans sp. Tduv TaxID=3158567 RepID=A0AAU7QRK5_9FLAO
MINISYLKKKYNLISKLIKFRKKKYLKKIKIILLLHEKSLILIKEINIFNIFLKKNIKQKKKIIYIYKIYKKKYLYINKKINNLLKSLPNIPNKNFYNYKNYKKNIIIYNNIYIYKKYKKKYNHIILGEKYKILDFKISSINIGRGFFTYINKGARLHNSLINFLLEENIKKKYIEFVFPYLITKNCLYGTGQIPNKKKQLYKIYKKNYYLIPTGEVPLINFYKNTIISSNNLPIKNTTYTSCFRKETGHYGIKNKGLKRLHQFDKVEITMITNHKSNVFLKKMMIHIKNTLLKLNIPFRIIRLSAKKLNYTSNLTYDFEIYSLVQKKWFEISSLSNCDIYQSNRLNIKFSKNKKTFLCHTLNGSNLSIPRLIMIILENNQYEKFIKIPNILYKFTSFKKIKKKNEKYYNYK